MKRCLILIFPILLLAGCKKETKETTVTETPAKPAPLSFETKTYAKKSTLCKEECTYVDIKVPEAVNGDPAIADSINTALFRIARGIVYFGEKPTNAKNYDELTSLFIKSYEDLVTKDPEEGEDSWEAKINAGKVYQSDNIINFKVNNFMFTGGAHGYEGDRSLIIDAKTGKTLRRNDIVKDEQALTAYAEKAFRKKFNIPANKSINSTGLMFEKNIYILSGNIFFSESGITLHYNAAEIGSFADGAKELFLPYSEVEQFLRVK